MIFLLALIIVGVTASYIGGTLATRRIRGSAGGDPELREIHERLNRLEQSMESATGELDRIAESQRFLTALLEERARSQPALRRPEGEPPR